MNYNNFLSFEDFLFPSSCLTPQDSFTIRGPSVVAPQHTSEAGGKWMVGASLGRLQALGSQLHLAITACFV